MDLFENLNGKQQEAVRTVDGPLLIIAGAGSGKTRVLTNRTAYLIKECGVAPWNILAVTFTNKAAGEMRERIDNLVGFGSDGIWVATFHATCVRILRRFIDRLGYGTNFTIYDSDDQKTVVKDICKRLQIDTKLIKERAFLNAISSAKDELVGPEEYEKRYGNDFKEQRIARVYREYQDTLKKSNALDFDDLIRLTVELFQLDKEVLDYYQEKFRYLMVDEYQDTNTAQFELIRLLASKYQNLCVVGDDDQSIYKFRGANIYNILNFEHHFPDARVIKLEQNYRSTQCILDAANAVIGNNTSRKEKSLWTENEGGEKITFRQFDTAYEEAEYISHDIWKKKQQLGIAYCDSAILYRTNAQSRLFEERFINAGIPYKIIGGINFYSRREIKDILAYLKTVDNASDDLAVKRIINVPKRGIGATTIAKADTFAIEQGITFFEALERAEEIPGLSRAAAKLTGFVNFIYVLRAKARELTISELIEEIFEETGYIRDLEAESTEEAKARIENLDELISKAAAYEESFADTEEEDEEFEGEDFDDEAREGRPTLSGFLEEVALVADIDELSTESDYVVLMTLHSAKGLEFPNVYLAGMEDGLFPSYMSITSENPTSELEEERRLCYVGITRAMQYLTITAAKMRMVRGETQYNAISRFVKEIPAALLDGEVRSPRRDARSEERPSQAAANAFRQTPYYLTQSKPKSFSSGRTEKIVLDYGVGDRVSHVKFGSGTVTAILEGGRDYEVTVAFDSAGVKKMFAMFAKLKKLDEKG